MNYSLVSYTHTIGWNCISARSSGRFPASRAELVCKSCRNPSPVRQPTRLLAFDLSMLYCFSTRNSPQRRPRHHCSESAQLVGLEESSLENA
jgi:hypothetical protein